MRSICLMAMLALTTVGAYAQAKPQEKAAGPADFPQRAKLQADALKAFDKDGDGKLNPEERKAMMADRMAMGEKMRKEREKQFDKDGDGKLNDAEKAAMDAANKERMEQFRQAREKQFDKDGDGKLNDEERAAMREAFQKHRPNAAPQLHEMMKKFDKDGDGKLSDEERKAMIEARKKDAGLPKPVAAPAAVN